MNFLTAFVGIKVDDSKLVSQLAKARSAVTKTVAKIKASFGKMAASFKAAFSKMVRYAKWGALAMAGALVLVARAAMKQEDVINRLAITLKATAHAAGLTKDELLKQAAALQQVTRFGDETIIAMQTMLLTFKNIRGNEFQRATEAALDMATAEAAVSGRAVDLTAVSIRLGKALNDPIIGLTALARVGVDFTDTQKELIKNLVRTGQTAEAQRVILKELESQFGGMARDVDTASGALVQMWNALGDVGEMIGAAFIPGIKSAAKAIKEWAERNQEEIGRWAETAVAYIAYVKDIFVSFVRYLMTDWNSGTQAAFEAATEIVKGFGESVIATMKWAGRKAAKVFGEELIYGLIKGMDVLGPIRRRIPGLKELDRLFEPLRKKMAETMGKQLIDIEVAPLAPRLKEIWKDVSDSIKDIVPPELAAEFDESFMKLKTRLEEIGMTAEEVSETMGEALVAPAEKMLVAMEESQTKLRSWADSAKDMYNNLADIAIRSFESTADSLTDLCLTGKADFNALAESILRDLTRMIIKAQMVQMFGAFMPGLFSGAGAAVAGGGMFGGLFGGAGAAAGTTFANPMAVMGAPGLQHGGTVEKSGLAVVHRGERFSGVPEEGDKREAAITINVNAIDAAGTYQFLNRNKRAIATMLQGTITSNHPLRRSKGWKS